ncbi:MAG: hypothetical protein A2287_05300 [Candidatus Melainabacteria bacterium RIFOXYA12_FULL_32_12]|nr:MAG: hypothetical protein A2255_08025 [Candidatus Melainabacteria bacterium RIFOXYA2_FULL_32_9]OGI31688.1 MAG: hypothetical protein A2287_05300 [Candidatus Melainabacteria bacterium RIFOXYA12_FULL_32_12]
MAEGLEFFISNTLRVYILILIIGFIIGVIREIITPAKTQKILSGKKVGMGNIISSFLAVITPVEDFSVIPVFIGFLEAGIPTSIAFTYLITAPMTNELAFALFWNVFGCKIAFIYYAIGIVIGFVGSILIGLFKLDNYIQPLIDKNRSKISHDTGNKSFKNIIIAAKDKSFSFFKSFWLYILIGIGIATLIQGYIPSDQIIKYVGFDNPFGVPIAVLMVMFFYINITIALPILMIFISHSLPIGTLMAFTMAVTATSIPELLILKRALKLPLLLTYIGVLLGLIILTGYLLNLIF